MKGLLIAAHGSRKQPSNEEVTALARQIRMLAGDAFDRVECGFVQFATPTVEAQIEKLVGDGVDHIVLFPYFLGSGSHVSEDIPRLVRETERRHPGVRIRVAPHLGVLDGLADLILDRVKDIR